MKNFRIIAVALLMTIGVISCKKDNDDAPAFVMEGQWTGKLGTGSGTPASQFALNLKTGGVLERLNSSGSVTGTGSWSLTGNNFTASYTFSSGTVVNLTGNLEKASNKLDGSWTNSGAETGLWNATHN
jgi:opacity protein-like surface antigen